MESLFGCKFSLLLLGLIAIVNGNTVLNLEVEPKKVQEGDNVILRCHVTNLVMGQFIRWSKIVDQDGTSVTYNIATNGQMETGFNADNSRYSADYSIVESNKVEFRLYINKVRNEDGGQYKCASGDIVAQNELVVHVQPKEIKLTLTHNDRDRTIQDGEQIKFEDGDVVSVKCQVHGANPQPEVNILIGDGELDNIQVFPHHSLQPIKGDSLGQVRSTYEVIAKVMDITISHENAADQTLTCEARVGEHEPLKTGFNIEMEGRPPVFECDATEQMAEEYADDVILQCTAKATPPVMTGHVYWYKNMGSEKVTFEPDQSSDNYRLIMETEDATGETTMRFHILRVAPQMFRNYTFYVYNDKGSAEHSILLFKGASSQVTVNLNLSKERAFPGEDLTVRCHVTSSKDMLISLVTWMKRAGGEEIEIGTNKFVNDNFRNTNRYHANLVYDSNKPDVIDFILNITNVDPTDSGEIGCKIPTNKVEVFKQFTVFSPVSNVVMTSRDLSGAHHMIHAEGQNVTFQEGEKRKFRCVVNGSYPAPNVMMLIGDKDISNLFVKEEKLLKKGEVLGLKALSYETTMSNDSLEITYEFSNKKLQCKATVPDSPNEPISQSILIELNGFSPKFECEQTQIVTLHQSDVNIRCVVKADPPVEDFKVYWKKKGENASLSNNMAEGHYQANIEHGDNPNENVMTLKIDRVFKQHFRDYVFEAENSKGRTQHTVTLLSDKDMASSVAAQTLASLVTILLISLVAYL